MSTDPGDVVVCGRSDDSYRLKPLPAHDGQAALPRAELGIGGARLAAEAEQVTLAGGAQSQRMMIRLKLPFGARKRAAP